MVWQDAEIYKILFVLLLALIELVVGQQIVYAEVNKFANEDFWKQ